MKEIISVQIPREIDAGFEILAKETHMPKVFHFEKALKEYLRQFYKSGSKFIPSDDKSEPNLDKPDLGKIDVTVRTKHIYQARLQNAKAEIERKKISIPLFFLPLLRIWDIQMPLCWIKSLPEMNHANPLIL